MSIKLNSVDVTQDASTVTVNDVISLADIDEGYTITIDGAPLPLSILSVVGSTINLKHAHTGTTITNRQAIILENKAPLVDLADTLKTVGDQSLAIINSIGTAAELDAQVSSTDTAAGRVMTVGAFGLGDSVFKSDWNTLITQGFYFSSGTATGLPSDFPSGQIAHGIVLESSGSGTVRQIITDGNGNTWLRGSGDQGVNWAAWVSNWHTGNLVKQTSSTDVTEGSMLTVGAGGLLSKGVPYNTDLNAAPEVNCRLSSSSLNNPNFPTAGTATVEVIESILTNVKSQIAFVQTSDTGSNSLGEIHFRNANISTGAWNPWIELWHTGNTTVDGNGFVKQASPIVKVYADHAEFNAESPETATYQRVSTGHYLIKGTLGFAQEGWYIETPKDANGNIKVFVEYEQLSDGTIELKTYEPDYSSGRAAAGVPTDITQGRWIDLRLQAPEVVEEIPPTE